MEDKRRYRIIEEIEKYIGIEEVPPEALTIGELSQMLNIGKKRLRDVLNEMGNQVNSARVQKINKVGGHYWTMVYWFEDEENTLHKP